MYTTIRNFDVKKINGIGETTAQKLHDAGVNTIDLLAHSSPADIQKKTGITLGLSTQHHSRARIALMASAGMGDITNTEECSECKGRGVIYNDEICPRCNGTTKIAFDDKDPCVSCGGQGIVTHTAMDDCPVCGGDGTVTLENFVSCGICRGTGIETYANKFQCRRCWGNGTIKKTYSYNCQFCGGDGVNRVWVSASSGTRECSTCGGSGVSPHTIANVFLSVFFPFGFLFWLCPDCTGTGVHNWYLEGYWTSADCYKCGGDGIMISTRTIDCPSCIDGTVTETHTRPCTACGGDGEQASTTTAQCGGCNGLGKTLNVSREKCNDCQGSGIIIENFEMGCPTCGESGILKSFNETMCLACKGEGDVAREVTELSGMSLESFVSSPTEDIVATGALDEPSTIAMKRAIGTLYLVLDEPCMRKLVL